MKPLGHPFLGLRSWKSAVISGLDGWVDGRWVDDREKGFCCRCSFSVRSEAGGWPEREKLLSPSFTRLGLNLSVVRGANTNRTAVWIVHPRLKCSGSHQTRQNERFSIS